MPRPSGKKNWSRFGCENQYSLCGQAVSTLQDTAAILTESLRSFSFIVKPPFRLRRMAFPRRGDVMHCSRLQISWTKKFRHRLDTYLVHLIAWMGKLFCVLARLASRQWFKQITDFNNCTFNVFVAEKIFEVFSGFDKVVKNSLRAIEQCPLDQLLETDSLRAMVKLL